MMSHRTIVEGVCCMLIILLLLGYIAVKDRPNYLTIYNYFVLALMLSCFFIAYLSRRTEDLNHGMGPDTVSGNHYTIDFSVEKEMVSIIMPPPSYNQLNMCGQCPQLLWEEPPNYDDLFGTSQPGRTPFVNLISERGNEVVSGRSILLDVPAVMTLEQKQPETVMAVANTAGYSSAGDKQPSS